MNNCRRVDRRDKGFLGRIFKYKIINCEIGRYDSVKGDDDWSYGRKVGRKF